MIKGCSKCKKSKDYSEFHKDKNRPTGLTNWCRTCYSEHSYSLKSQKRLRSYHNNPENKKRYENNRLKRTYGINLDQYNQMLFNQNCCCAICGKNKTEFKTSFHVDHCHKTLVIRGLLCFNCNIAIGNFYENIETLKSAIEYLNGKK